MKGTHWQLMNGSEVRIWVDRWLPSIPEGHPIPRSDGNVNEDQRVSSSICSHNGNWNPLQILYHRETIFYPEFTSWGFNLI